MKNENIVEKWLKRARSNLARARAGKVSEEVLYEDLCFDCQQAVEKSLKALLVFINVEFPWTHLIARLIELVEANGIDTPEEVKEAASLTEYAANTRYPGNYEPLDEEDYKEALEIAERVVNWVEGKLAPEHNSQPNAKTQDTKETQ
ncbi:HEPN domain-containing protein [Candidatus Poribacteria bacterium]|nr:HEPN domain-containing protein [Candidatus Poribacteria bacterium]